MSFQRLVRKTTTTNLITKKNQTTMTKLPTSLLIPLSLFQVTDEHMHFCSGWYDMTRDHFQTMCISQFKNLTPFFHYVPMFWQWFSITKDCNELSTSAFKQWHICRIVRLLKKKKPLNTDNQLFLLRTFFIVYRLVWMLLEIHGVQKGDDIMCCILDYISCFIELISYTY